MKPGSIRWDLGRGDRGKLSILARGSLGLATAAIRRPRTTIFGLMVLVALAAPGLLRLKMRTDGHALVPRSDPVILEDAEIRQHFDLRDQILILVESRHPDGIFNARTLAKVQAITDAVAAIEGVGERYVTSLATESRDRVYPGTLNFRPYLDPLPDTPEQIAELRGDLDAAEILYGTLVSRDGTATSILVGVPSATPGDGSRLELYRQIRAVVAPFESAQDSILVVGAPVAEALLGIHVLEDLVVLLPLSLAMISLVIWIGCRRFWGVALALMEVGACLVFTFGCMGWLGFPVFLTTAVLPVILTTVGLADEIHIFWHFQRVIGRLWPESRSTASAVEATLAALGRPVVLSSLTTSLAFLSFLASPIDPVWSFGLFAAVGTLFCMFWSLTVVPACLTLLSADSMRPVAEPWGREGFAVLGKFLGRNRLLALGCSVLVTLGLGVGALDIVVQDSWVDGFAADSDFRRATEAANRYLHGTHTLWVHLAFDPPPERIPTTYSRQGPLLDPALVEALGRVESFIAANPRVGGVLGPHSHLTTVAYLWLGRQEELRRIPENPDRLERLVTRFEQGRGIDRRREVLDDGLSRTVISVFLGEANFRDTKELLADIEGVVSRELAPWRPKISFGGDVAVSQAMIPAIVKTQISSLALAILGAFLVVWLLERSLSMALLAIVPTACAVVWILGGMGWLGIPLGVATSMFCAITLGIGVDYAIHFLVRIHQWRAEGGENPVLQALQDAGPAIVFDALAISAGFGLLVVSRVPANNRLGLLVAGALFASCILTLLGLGAALSPAVRSRAPRPGVGAESAKAPVEHP